MKKLDNIVSVRFSGEDNEHLRWLAKATGLTYSEVVRMAVRRMGYGTEPPVRLMEALDDLPEGLVD